MLSGVWANFGNILGKQSQKQAVLDMQRNEAPWIELSKAKEAISQMDGAKTLADFEEAWKKYLFRLERCCNKAQAHFKKSPKWDAWWGSYKKIRSTDQLLSYLVYARGAEEHSVEEIVGRTPHSTTINPVQGRSLIISHLSTDAFGRINSISSPQPLSIVFQPGRMTLLPVVNRGREYPVPTIHLGEKIDPLDVCAIAKKGHAFYSGFLSAAESYFIK